ncbi:hypothetical protein Tco_1465215 [Tanacetum coccineum]
MSTVVFLLWIELIDITNKSVKNLVFSGYDAPYIYFVEINALYIVSLTIKARLPLEKLLLMNVSSITKVELDYYKALFDDESLEMYDQLKEDMLKGLLLSLGHAKEVIIREFCLESLIGLKAKGLIYLSNMKVLALNDENLIIEEIGTSSMATTSGTQEVGQSSTHIVDKINVLEKRILGEVNLRLEMMTREPLGERSISWV